MKRRRRIDFVLIIYTTNDIADRRIAIFFEQRATVYKLPLILFKIQVNARLEMTYGFKCKIIDSSIESKAPFRHGARALKWTSFRNANALNRACSQTTGKRS